MAAVARTTLAEIEFASGFVEEALRLNEQTTQHFRERSNLIGLPLTLCNAAACLVALKRYREAQDRAGEALRRSLAIGSVRGALWAMQHLAAAAAFDEGVGDKNLLARAVQLLGFVDEAISRRAIPRCFTEQREYDKMVHVLGRALGQDAIRRYMADGKAWPEERAIEEAFHSFAV